jgi:putative transcriptional regulator
MIYAAEIQPLMRRLMEVVVIALLIGTSVSFPACASQLATGVLLVADDDEADPYFQGTVILVVDHRLSGSRGLIINRPTRFLLGELLFNYASQPSSNAHVYFGGPKDTKQLRYLVRSLQPLPGAHQIADGIWYGPGSENLPSSAARVGGDRLRLFAGYVHWPPGQLDVEVKRGRWKLLPARAEHLFRIQSGDLWPFLWRHTRKDDWVDVAQQ